MPRRKHPRGIRAPGTSITYGFTFQAANLFLEEAARRESGGYDIRTVQELLGHKDLKTTMVYTHGLNRGGKGVKSPLDDL